MTYSSASAEMFVQTSTITPTAMPSRLERTSQPRSPFAEPLSAAPRPTTPVASEYAPKRSVNAYRLMPGQARTTTPSAPESTPFRPSAHLIFVSCVVAALVARSNVDSMLLYLPIVRLTTGLSSLGALGGIGDAGDRVRKPRNPAYRRWKRTYATPPAGSGSQYETRRQSSVAASASEADPPASASAATKPPSTKPAP